MTAEDHENNWLIDSEQVRAMYAAEGRAALAKNISTVDFSEFGITPNLMAIHDWGSARDGLDVMSVLKSVLKARRAFRAKQCEYCLAEFRMWLRIVEIGKTQPVGSRIDGNTAKDKLTLVESRIYEWLLGKSQEDLDMVAFRCSKGQGVNEQRLEEGRIAYKLRAREIDAEKYQSVAEKIVNEGECKGITRCSVESFLSTWGESDAPNTKTVKAYVEKTRDELLHKGFVGIADGRGTYVKNDGSGDTVMLSRAIANRITSLCYDMESLRQLCVDNNLEVPDEQKRRIKSAVNALVGVISLTEVA